MTRGANNNVLIQNRSWSNTHQGIEDINCTGNFHVGDVSWGNDWNGFAVEGGATGTTLYDCIATENAPLGFTANLEVDPSSAPGFTSNDNLFWDPTGRPLVIFNGSRYTNVVDFAAATGQDTRTIQADPRFSNPGAGNFDLEPDSPAIDNANSGIPHWPSSDALGRPRRDDLVTPNAGLGTVLYADRGALEFQPDGSEPIHRPRRIPTTGGPPGHPGEPDAALSAPARGPSSASDTGAAPADRATDLTPNPTRGSVTLVFTLSRPGVADIRVYDIQSRIVRSLPNVPIGRPGRNVVHLDGRDNDGVALRPGVYLYEIRAGAERTSGRFVVMR